MIVVALIVNNLFTAHRMVLGFYTWPTLFAAYYYGRRYATLAAFASVFLVGLLAYYNPDLFVAGPEFIFIDNTRKLLSNYAAVFSAIGQAHCNEGKFEEARVVLEKGLEVLHPFWGIYQVLSRAYEGLGEFEKALEVGQKALAVAGENEKPMIYASLLPMYQRAGKLDEFSNLLNERVETNVDEFSAYWALFRTYHVQEKFVEATNIME